MKVIKRDFFLLEGAGESSTLHNTNVNTLVVRSGRMGFTLHDSNLVTHPKSAPESTQVYP